MIDHRLNIGDLIVSKNKDMTFTCFGLGSCIGLFLQDRITGISGGAHILLPSEIESPNIFGQFYSVQSAINELLLQFKKRGSSLMTLRAKVTGGANVLSSDIEFATGKRNTENVINNLIKNKIFIAASETGGQHARTAKFNCKTGELLVRKPDSEEINIY